MRHALFFFFFVVVDVVGLAGCARTHLFYDARELRHPPLQSEQSRVLVNTLADRLKDRKIVWVDGAGREHAVAPDASGLSKLGLPELGALWLATAGGDVGGENDVRVRVGRGGSVPVSVLTALDGSIRLISSPKGVEPDDEPALTEEEIRERFHLRTKLPGKWQEVERRALVQSLDSLAPEELAIVRSIDFERQAAPRDKDPSRAALYEMQGCRAVIFLYSSGVRSDLFRFVGDPATPKSAVLHSIVHEIGHAFEQSAAREKYCAAQKARDNKLVDEGNALADESPVLRAYMGVLAGEPAPTDYGNTSPHESFAESFALFHVDPAALKRVRPAVYAWFESGGHLKVR